MRKCQDCDFTYPETLRGHRMFQEHLDDNLDHDSGWNAPSLRDEILAQAEAEWGPDRPLHSLVVSRHT